MALSVKYDNPAYPKGEEVEVQGLGLLTNGSPVEVSESQEAAFAALYGHTLKEHADEDANLTVTGSAVVKPAETEKAEGGEK